MAKYIDKSAIKAEIEKRISQLESKYKELSNLEIWITAKEIEHIINGLKVALSIVNTLEVKEVDFDNDLIEEVYSHLDGIKDTADRMTSGNFMHHRAAIKFSANVIEKVLGLIGLKTQKEE